MKSINGLSRVFARLFLSAAFLLTVVAGFVSPVAAGSNDNGSIYTLSNAAAGNAVLAYTRARNGKLSFKAQYSTGGLGTGAGLGSQGSLVLTDDNRWLLAVNAGSNQISVFAVRPSGLSLVDVAD